MSAKTWRYSLILAILISLFSTLTLVYAQGELWPGLTVSGTSSGPAMPGETVTFQVEMLNHTAETIPNAYLTHVLPTGFSYVPNSAQVTFNGSTLQIEPAIDGSALSWGPYTLPPADVGSNNPFGIHTMVQDLCTPHFINVHLDQALNLIGKGGYVTQLFYGISANTTQTDPCAVYFVNRAYDLGLNPIIRLGGNRNDNFWIKPDDGANDDYAEVAHGFATFTAGLPLRDNQPLYITIWNEPNVWLEWSGQPNAEEYARFFVATSNAIRALNEERLIILNGATSPPHDETQQFTRNTLNVPGFVDAFDVWASHPYAENHPAWYNSHNGTAIYPEAAIDSYLIERDILAEYGRTGVKFILKETGYGLGNDIYGFEGFPTINDNNRTEYITDAFDTYWRNWPEVIAVTPFELGSPNDGWNYEPPQGIWDHLDWIDYGPDPLTQYNYYPQYNAVAALEKPNLITIPTGVQITFEAAVGPNVSAGRHASYLYALLNSGGTGSLGTGSLAVPISTTIFSEYRHLYLPLVMKNYTPSGSVIPPGSLYLPQTESIPLLGASPDGAIVPTDLLTGSLNFEKINPNEASLFHKLNDTPLSLTVDPRTGLTHLSLPEGKLITLTPDGQRPQTLDLDATLIKLLPGPQANTLYGLGDDNIVRLINLNSGETVAQSALPQRVRDMAFDPISGDLFVADAGAKRILRLSADLSHLKASLPIPGNEFPEQLLLNADARRLIVTLPGNQELWQLNLDTLKTVKRAKLIGGPFIWAVEDTNTGRLFVLSALTPKYRGLFVIEADSLAFERLLGGTLSMPFQQAQTVLPLPNGQLLIPEGRLRYQVDMETLSLEAVSLMEAQIGKGDLLFDTVNDRVIWIAGAEVLVD